MQEVQGKDVIAEGSRVFALKPFDVFLIAGVLVCSIGYNILNRDASGGFDWLGILSAVSGLFCVVLVAHGNKLNYLFGIVNVTTYAYISYKSNLLGDCLLNALYYLPMQFIGWAVWTRRRSGESAVQVRAKSMSPRRRTVWILASLALVGICGLLLSILKGKAVEGSFIMEYHLYSEYPFKDALTTVFAIVAQYLMTKAWAEQWFYWIAMDVVSVAIWLSFLAGGTPHSGLMVIMYVFYLANAINGARIWSLLAKRENMLENE